MLRRIAGDDDGETKSFMYDIYKSESRYTKGLWYVHGDSWEIKSISSLISL